MYREKKNGKGRRMRGERWWVRRTKYR